MNLVDAIRQAALGAREPLGSVQAHVLKDPAIEAVQPDANDPNDSATVAVNMAEAMQAAGEQADDSFPHGYGLNLVRLEVFLTPEQMAAMLKGALTSQRSVMTLREAAAYLRLHINVVERMAQEGKLPGFTIEGSWRFLKASIDEWLSAQHPYDQEDSHVA